jgi:soluble lytic murein transglycosylase-like protein
MLGMPMPRILQLGKFNSLMTSSWTLVFLISTSAAVAIDDPSPQQPNLQAPLTHIQTAPISSPISSNDVPAARAENPTFPQIIWSNLSEKSTTIQLTLEQIRMTAPDSVAPNKLEQGLLLYLQAQQSLIKGDLSTAQRKIQLSLQYLPKESQFYPIAKMVALEASLNQTKPLASLQSLKELTKKYPSFTEWKPEQYALMIKILIKAKSDKLLYKTWTEYLEKTRPSQRIDGLDMELAAYVDQSKSKPTKELVSALESMASLYPYTRGSQWAFAKLQTVYCLDKKDKVWSRPSLALLQRLSMNATLDDGLKAWILSALSGPLRSSNWQIKSLDTQEKIQFLMVAKFYAQALEIVQKSVDELKTSREVSSLVKLKGAKLKFQLGQIYARLNQWQDSATAFSTWISEFGDQYDRRGAEEGLADAMSRLKLYSPAAKIYARLAISPNVDPVIKWHHFWNTYLSGDYKEALTVLERPGYVPLRDRGIDGGLEYWRAKILEKLGEAQKADAEFKRVIFSNGDTFYSILVNASKPALREANVQPAQSPAQDGGQKLMEELAGRDSFAAKLIGAPAVEPSQQELASEPTDIAISKLLQKWGQNKMARRLLRTTSWKHALANQAFADMATLAYNLGDYGFGLKAVSVPDSPFRNLPTSTKDLKDHILGHNQEWRYLYPFAHEKLVRSYSDAANIDPYLLLGIMRAESVYDPDARSYVGAQGLMQIMPFTAIRIAKLMGDDAFSLDTIHMPEVNIGYGAFYLKRLVDYYDQNTILAIAAYNAGPHNVDHWLRAYGHLGMDEFVESIPFKETRRYVKSVLRNMNQYQIVYSARPTLTNLPNIPDKQSNLEIF